MMRSSQKFCTNCGALLLDKNYRPALELYDEELHRKSNILKLMVCSKCTQVADKYIECDGSLLLIDLALQSKEAYRHVLFNGGYSPLIVRMVLLTLICDGYIEWSHSAEAGEFFEQEYDFYLKCFKIVLGIVTFLFIVLIPCLFKKAPNARIDKLLLGLLLSYCSRFCNLIALLWAPKNNADSASLTPDLNYFTSPQIMWGFIVVLFFISSVRVYEGKCLVFSNAEIHYGWFGSRDIFVFVFEFT